MRRDVRSGLRLRQRVRAQRSAADHLRQIAGTLLWCPEGSHRVRRHDMDRNADADTQSTPSRPLQGPASRPRTADLRRRIPPDRADPSSPTSPSMAKASRGNRAAASSAAARGASSACAISRTSANQLSARPRLATGDRRPSDSLYLELLAQSRVEPAYFVVARRGKASPLAPPQHGGARFPDARS